MCTRYYIEPENADLLPYVDLAGRTFIARHFLELGDTMKREGEIRPSDVAPVIATGRSRRKGVFPMKWGYTMARTSGSRPSLLLRSSLQNFSVGIIQRIHVLTILMMKNL